MTCREARNLFSAWVDETLSGEERATLGAHLTTCADCRLELERFHRTVELLRAAEPVRAPVGFVDRVLAAARPVPWYRRLVRRRWTPIPAAVPIQAVALVLVALTAVYLWQRVPDGRPLRQAERFRESVHAGRDAFRSAEPQSVPAEEQKRAASGRDPAGPDGEAGPAPAVPSPTGEPGRPEPMPSVARRANEGAAGLAGPPDAHRMEATKRSQVGGSVDQLSIAADVSGRLTVGTRAAANRALDDLLARLGGTEVARRAEPGPPAGEMVDVVVRRAAYVELIAGLGRIGRWVPDRGPDELPPEVRVRLRITER